LDLVYLLSTQSLYFPDLSLRSSDRSSLSSTLWRRTWAR